MTNWQKFKISRITTDKEEIRTFGIVIFELEKYVDYGEHHGRRVMGTGCIACENRYPISDCRAGDWLEVDVDEARKPENEHKTFDTSVVRKFGEVVSSLSGSLTIPTTPSSAAEVARVVTQTVLDHADRTKGVPQIEIGTDKTSIRYYPPK